jgi:uncharacterized protein YydD (DUF2326 family)
MYLKSLTISTPTKVIRDIQFRRGINLIVDETLGSDDKETGNNVGKTTVLALIDFCLGADAKGIWTDPESKRQVYALVKDFLVNQDVKITLVLKEDLTSSASREVVIERNFGLKSKAIRKINGIQVLEKDFDKIELGKAILPDLQQDRPTFKQLISHNIRYEDPALSNTLKTLNKYTSDVEYEALHLFMFGIDFQEGALKQALLVDLQKEQNFKNRLEKNLTKNQYLTLEAAVVDEIHRLEQKKLSLGYNDRLEEEIAQLNLVQVDINRVSMGIVGLRTRHELIRQAEAELNTNRATIDMPELNRIYAQTSQLLGPLQRSFEELVSYHNQMVDEKIRFITQELPELEARLHAESGKLATLRQREQQLRSSITQSASFDELEDLLEEINDAYRKKGEYQGALQLIASAEEIIHHLESDLDKIDKVLFSSESEELINRKLLAFNRSFQRFSHELYGEPYFVISNTITKKTGAKVHQFSTFNEAMSSGKKQGEIAAFDIAYTLFAREEAIPHLPFFLYDKKELVHDNQISTIAKLAEKYDIQIITPILQDKLPPRLNRDEYIVLRLSQEDKLFRIEQNS